jgi:hypothetical protein
MNRFRLPWSIYKTDACYYPIAMQVEWNTNAKANAQASTYK